MTLAVKTKKSVSKNDTPFHFLVSEKSLRQSSFIKAKIFHTEIINV